MVWSSNICIFRDNTLEVWRLIEGFRKHDCEENIQTQVLGSNRWLENLQPTVNPLALEMDI